MHPQGANRGCACARRPPKAIRFCTSRVRQNSGSAGENGPGAAPCENVQFMLVPPGCLATLGRDGRRAGRFGMPTAKGRLNVCPVYRHAHPRCAEAVGKCWCLGRRLAMPATTVAMDLPGLSPVWTVMIHFETCTSAVARRAVVRPRREVTVRADEARGGRGVCECGTGEEAVYGRDALEQWHGRGSGPEGCCQPNMVVRWLDQGCALGKCRENDGTCMAGPGRKPSVGLSGAGGADVRGRPPGGGRPPGRASGGTRFAGRAPPVRRSPAGREVVGGATLVRCAIRVRPLPDG